MSLAELLPDVQSLTRVEKIRLVEVLVQDLELEATALIKDGATYSIQSPDQDFEAAAVMLQVLEDYKGQR